MAAADDFSRPMQELSTEYCWGYVWGRPGLELRDRSLINIAMISALNRPHELKLHVRGAIHNDMGAYMRTNGAVGARNVCQFLAGPYRVPHVKVDSHLWMTNKTPVGTYHVYAKYTDKTLRGCDTTGSSLVSRTSRGPNITRCLRKSMPMLSGTVRAMLMLCVTMRMVASIWALMSRPLGSSAGKATVCGVAGGISCGAAGADPGSVVLMLAGVLAGMTATLLWCVLW
mgnify:CR=1 FL=1